MTIYLTDDEKRNLLQGTLKSFAIESYSHELNRQVALNNGDEKAIAVSEQAIATIEAATITYEAELLTLTIALEGEVSA